MTNVFSNFITDIPGFTTAPFAARNPYVNIFSDYYADCAAISVGASSFGSCLCRTYSETMLYGISSLARSAGPTIISEAQSLYSELCSICDVSLALSTGTTPPVVTASTTSAPSTGTQTPASSAMQAASTGPQTPVTSSITTTDSVAAAATSASSTSSGLDESQKIALGTGLSVPIAAFLVGIAGLYRRKRRREEEQEMGERGGGNMIQSQDTSDRSQNRNRSGNVHVVVH